MLLYKSGENVHLLETSRSSQSPALGCSVCNSALTRAPDVVKFYPTLCSFAGVYFLFTYLHMQEHLSAHPAAHRGPSQPSLGQLSVFSPAFPGTTRETGRAQTPVNKTFHLPGPVVMLLVIVAAEPPSGVAALSPLRSGNQQRAGHGARRARLHSRCLCSRDGRRARTSPHGDFHQRRCCRTR